MNSKIITNIYMTPYVKLYAYGMFVVMPQELAFFKLRREIVVTFMKHPPDSHVTVPVN